MSQEMQGEAADDDLGLQQFETPSAETGLSLEQLSQSYADVIGGGEDPYELQPPRDATDLPCPVSPRTILEAMLFVGHPENEPLTSRQVASLMRGVRPAEIDELVRQLNAAYEAEGCVFTIGSVEAGYCLQLRPQYASLRDRFYGKVRAARLSQAAIDVLAIVAYNQPLTREQVDNLRGKPSGGILTQLVRRQLLRVERPDKRPRRPRYHTTDRFLHLFGLESLNELPRSQELERPY